MNPRTSSIIAIFLVAIAGVIGLLSLNPDENSSESAPAKDRDTRASDRLNGSPPTSRPGRIGTAEPPEKLVEKTELARVERAKLTAMWTKNASRAFQQAMKNLAADLDLSEGETAELAKIFARREQELAGLLNGDAADQVETLGKICALLRNKYLREELANILTPEKLAAFDANEATRERETIEARAYRDMAEINDVVSLTDTQKQQALAALMRNAPAKVEQEADARAYMTLHYGQMLTDVDPSYIRGLSNLVSGSLNHEIPTSNSTSPAYEQWTQDQKAGRIQSEIQALQGILDDQQLARYCEHLERELPW